MMDDSINGWIHKPGPINLRHTARIPTRQEGVGVVGYGVIGFAILVWLYDFALWFRWL